MATTLKKPPAEVELRGVTAKQLADTMLAIVEDELVYEPDLLDGVKNTIQLEARFDHELVNMAAEIIGVHYVGVYYRQERAWVRAALEILATELQLDLV
jgi:hypothetical protein